MSAEVSYKPSAYYFRSGLRAAKTKAQAVEIGLKAVTELEQLKAWVREHGMIPPKNHILEAESRAKGWTVVA